MKVGFTAGAFDLCHAGHILMFKEARENCDHLVVGLHRDPSVERASKHKPIMSLEERLIILEGIKYIDHVFVYDTEAQLVEHLRRINPDVRFIGEDWRGKPFTGHELNLPIHWNGRDHGYSSSELRERIYNAEAVSRRQ